MATQSSILAWEITWTEEPSRLQSLGSQRVRHDLATKVKGSEVAPSCPTLCGTEKRILVCYCTSGQHLACRDLPVRSTDLAPATLQLRGPVGDWESTCSDRRKAKVLVTQAPLSVGFSRQEYPCSPPGDVPDPGIEPG